MTTTTTTIADPATVPDGQLAAFNPAELDMSANSRTDAEASVTADDVASAKAHAGLAEHGCGNEVPIELRRRPDGTLRVRDGHRRTIMCQRAGVPVHGYVAGAEGDEQADLRARLLGQWFANHHRVAPSRSDDTNLLLTLFDDGKMSETAIGKATGLKRPQVKTALTVARSQVARKAADRWEFLTLDQAVALAEFEGDPEALTALVQAAKDSPSQFDHVVARLRDTRAEREAKGAFVSELETQGVAIYGDRPYVPWTMALENLRGGDGNEITPEAHATCPGRAVTITYEWNWAPDAEAAYRAAHDLAEGDIEFGTDEEAREAGFTPHWQVDRYLCTDPEQYGHTNVHGRTRETPTTEQRTAEDEAAEAARATEERRRVRRRNTEWRTANEVRTSHVKAVLASKAPPAGALKLIVGAIARGETQPLMSSHGHQTACELLCLTGDGSATGYRDMLLAELARASEKRAQMIALAMVLGAAEDGVRDVHTWQSAEGAYWTTYGIPAAARYLAWLAEHTGYGLSEIEAEVAAHATAGAGQPAGETEAGAGQDAEGDVAGSDDIRQDQSEAADEAGSPATVEAD